MKTPPPDDKKRPSIVRRRVRRGRPGRASRRYVRNQGLGDGTDLPAVARRPLMTPKQLADMLQVSPATVKRLVGSGNIPVVQVGSQHRFERSEVIRALKKPRAPKKCD